MGKGKNSNGECMQQGQGITIHLGLLEGEHFLKPRSCHQLRCECWYLFAPAFETGPKHIGFHVRKSPILPAFSIGYGFFAREEYNIVSSKLCDRGRLCFGRKVGVSQHHVNTGMAEQFPHGVQIDAVHD